MERKGNSFLSFVWMTSYGGDERKQKKVLLEGKTREEKRMFSQRKFDPFKIGIEMEREPEFSRLLQICLYNLPIFSSFSPVPSLSVPPLSFALPHFLPSDQTYWKA